MSGLLDMSGLVDMSGLSDMDDLDEWLAGMLDSSIAGPESSAELKGPSRPLDIHYLPSEGSSSEQITPSAADHIVGCWTLLQENPFRIQILKQLREACCRNFGAMFPDMSLMYFAWLCTLSFLSRKFHEWGMGDTDWWPLAGEDEIMMVSPYARKSEWHCENTGCSGHYWAINRNNDGAAEVPFVDRQSSSSDQSAIVTLEAFDSDATMPELKIERQSPEHYGPPTDSSPEPDCLREVPMFTCQSMKLFRTQISEESDEIDDDVSVFTKLRARYWTISGLLGRWSLTSVLKGIRCVKVVAYKDSENTIQINIVDWLQDKADCVPPSQWRTFLLEPKKCEKGQALYRKRLPRYPEGTLDSIGYGGALCQALYFQHAARRGLFAVICFGIILISFLVGICYSLVQKDTSGGFAVAACGGLPLALTIALWVRA